MSYRLEDAEELAKKLQYELTAHKAKLSELQRMIAWFGTQLPPSAEKVRCPQCGLEMTERKLGDHQRNVHGVEQEAA